MTSKPPKLLAAEARHAAAYAAYAAAKTPYYAKTMSDNEFLRLRAAHEAALAALDSVIAEFYPGC